MTITYMRQPDTCRKAQTALRISNMAWDAGNYRVYQIYRRIYKDLLADDRDTVPCDVAFDDVAPGDVEGW